MKLGARVFKTGVAIVFSLFIADLLQLPSPVFAGIAAIFAIQPSIYRSYLTVIEQVQSNLIGAAIAVVFALSVWQSFYRRRICCNYCNYDYVKIKVRKNDFFSTCHCYCDYGNSK